ncbi:MAG: NAD-dependent epimerase/dehydratase family protein [Steroidobacter sp.]
MNRRDVMKMGTAAAGVLLANNAFAQSKPLKVLIFGGTGFIGPHFVEVLRAGGHKLTLFNRGKRNPGLFPDIETLIGDRNGQLDALKGRDWDVVIDDSGYFPAQVKLSAELLKDHVQHYIYVSSISAYADLTPPGIDEDYKVAQLKDPNAKEITEENYGGLKAACEQIVEQTYGERQAVIRPTYIVGPGDTSDRFTYWPVRVARGGEMLAPGTARDPVQFIDVRDLAEFMRICVEQRIGGRYNLCNPPGAVTMGEVLETSKRLSKSNASFVWADAKFLEAHKALESGEIPIWSPTTGEFAGGALVSSARAVAKGLRFRDLEITVRDTLAWHAKRPDAQKQKLRAGLTAEREAELLKELKRSA